MAHIEVPAPYYTADAGDGPDSAGLFEYWRMIRRHKKTLCLSAFCGLVLAGVVGIVMKPVYKVHTSIEVLNVNEDFMNMKQTSPETTSDFSYDTSEEETQAQLLQSDALLERVMRKLDPDYALIPSRPRIHSWWRPLLHLQEKVPMTDREKLLADLVESLHVRSIPRTRILEATVKSTDPKLAADFANTLTSEFIERSLEARWKTTQKTNDWLSGEINAQRAKLERAEDALQAYARTSGLIFTDDNTNVATEKLQQLQQELSAVTADRIAKQSRYELAKNSPVDSLPDVLNDDSLRTAAGNIATLKAQIAQLAATYGSEYSKLQQAQAQLPSLEAAFQHDRDAIVKRIANDYQEAKRKEELLATAYDAQTRAVSGFDEKAVKYNILKREADSNRQLYDTMLLQLKESSLASALHATNVHVVDPAEIPGKPSWPNFRILFPLGLLSGVFFGMGMIVIRERADRSLQQPGEAQLWTNLPELGTIPSASVDGKRKLSRRAQPSITAGPAEDKPVRPSELVTLDRKSSLTAEAFRSTLTSILFIGENGSRPKVLVFTSANASEGKTTVVSNLGIAIAEIRTKVLVIDADLRRPRMHELFGVSNERGLADLLREQTLTAENIQAAIQKTEIPGLDLLPAGAPTHAAANLLYSPNTSELLTRLRKQYDMVLIDTPPMLQMTDARVIGRLSDAVVLVARSEQTTRDALVAAARRFSEDRIRVLGTIFNDWNPKRSANGYYGYYAYRPYGDKQQAALERAAS
jgi:capsular exopolysaccharide synthesis family protein